MILFVIVNEICIVNSNFLQRFIIIIRKHVLYAFMFNYHCYLYVVNIFSHYFYSFFAIKIVFYACNINTLQLMNCIWVIKEIWFFSTFWYLMGNKKSKFALFKINFILNVIKYQPFHFNHVHKQKINTIPYPEILNKLFLIQLNFCLPVLKTGWSFKDVINLVFTTNIVIYLPLILF